MCSGSDYCDLCGSNNDRSSDRDSEQQRRRFAVLLCAPGSKAIKKSGHGNRRKNLVLMLCVPSAPCTGGAVLFSTEHVECRSAYLRIASMHILMLTPYRLRQTCNDFRRLQCLLTPSNH